MRVLLQGGSEHETVAIAAALRRGGLAVADPGDDAFDLIVTLGGAMPVPIRVGALEIDPLARTILLAGRRLRLTPIEQALLEALARARRPLPRSDLLRQIWGYHFDPGTNLVAVHIHRLRAKIGAGWIACDGRGYRLTDGEG